MIEQTKSTKLNTSHRPPSCAHQGSLAQVGPCEELENLLREILIFLLQFLFTHSLQKIIRKTKISCTFFLNSGGSVTNDIVAGERVQGIGNDLRICCVNLSLTQKELECERGKDRAGHVAVENRALVCKLFVL